MAAAASVTRVMRRVARVTTTNANYHFVITKPGSYYLSANLSVTKPNGIRVATTDVTLDLNGFAIQRASSVGPGTAVEIDLSAWLCTVKNGSIGGLVASGAPTTSFQHGVHALSDGDYAFAPFSGSFVDLTVGQCTGTAIAAGIGSRIERCSISDSGTGITAGPAAVIIQATVVRSQSNGIVAAAGALVSNCTIAGSAPSKGIQVGTGSMISKCTVRDTASQHAIHAGAGSTVAGCTVSTNFPGAATSAYGIFAPDGAVTITRCSVSDVGPAQASDTSGVGISAGSTSTVSRCTVNNNKSHGIVIGSDSVVLDCTTARNGTALRSGAGIRATGGRNRIKGNTAVGNPRGIAVALTGNLIEDNHVRNNTGAGIEVPTTNGKNIVVRNSAGGNGTNYAIAAGNSDAPVATPTSATNPFTNIQN